MSAISTLSRLFSNTDEAAMCRVKEHDDHREFARLLKRWEEPIRRLCTRMTGDPDRGDDLKQDVFLRLFEKRKSYQPKSRFSTFLWRIALNRCYDELRQRRRRREFVEPDPETSGAQKMEPAAEDAGPDLQTASLEEGELVRQAVLELPDIYRAVVVLRHYEGMKLGRIAQVLEIPEGTVNSRMAEALGRLSRILAPKLKAATAANPMRSKPNSAGVSNLVREAFL
jgi:RNA polymerase sigma-70 factor, ECF subfamily